MNDPLPPLDKLDALFSSLRKLKPETSRAEYAFETRLLARLRQERQTALPWAKFSWRMIPVFSVLVMGLVFWQVQASSLADEAAQLAYVENPESGNLGNE